MMNQPHVTIIVPTYNRASLVANAVDSALSQDYEALDVIVVDDGSTDHTGAVLSRYTDEARVTIIRRPQNGGVTAAKNTGLEAIPTTTTYVGILDSDDTLETDAVRSLVHGFDKVGQPLSQVFGWCRDPKTGEDTGAMVHREGLIRFEDAACGRFHGEFWQLIRAELVRDQRFDERCGGQEAMIWWPLMRHQPAYLIDKVVRQYDRSGTDRVSLLAFEAHGARRKMWSNLVMLERVGADMLQLCPERYAFFALEAAKWAALAGERHAARSALRKAWHTHRSWRVLRVAALAALPPALARAAYRWRYSTSQ